MREFETKKNVEKRSFAFFLFSLSLLPASPIFFACSNFPYAFPPLHQSVEVRCVREPVGGFLRRGISRAQRERESFGSFLFISFRFSPVCKKAKLFLSLRRGMWNLCPPLHARPPSRFLEEGGRSAGLCFYLPAVLITHKKQNKGEEVEEESGRRKRKKQGGKNSSRGITSRSSPSFPPLLKKT